jgi:hypothetical protein
MREHAHYFLPSRGERENRRLLGGEGRIRTPEALYDSRGGIQALLETTVSVVLKTPPHRSIENR